MSEPYRIRSAETWDAARLAYLDGCSADEVCVRFDLGLSALRKRAKAEGWRRSDQAEAEPFDDADDADDLPDMDDQALADLARRRMGVAARRGRRPRPCAGHACATSPCASCGTSNASLPVSRPPMRSISQSPRPNRLKRHRKKREPSSPAPGPNCRKYRMYTRIRRSRLA